MWPLMYLHVFLCGVIVLGRGVHEDYCSCTQHRSSYTRAATSYTFVTPTKTRKNKRIPSVKEMILAIYLKDLQGHLLICGIAREAIAHGLDNDIDQQLIAPWRPAIARQMTVRNQFLYKRDLDIT